MNLQKVIIESTFKMPYGISIVPLLTRLDRVNLETTLSLTHTGNLVACKQLLVA